MTENSSVNQNYFLKVEVPASKGRGGVPAIMAIDSSSSSKILVGVSTGKLILYELSRDKPMQVV